MRWAMVITLAAVIALHALPVRADLRCGGFNQIDRWLRGPIFNEVEIELWIVAGLTFRYYRNDLTGTWTVIYSWVNRPGRVAACVVTSGIGARKQNL